MNYKEYDGMGSVIFGPEQESHRISTSQLAELGLEEIAFVKPVMTETGPAFAIHAADGTPMAIASDAQLAAAAIIQNDMRPSSVH